MKTSLANLQWKNLKDNSCPKCGSPLQFVTSTGLLDGGEHQCTKQGCQFKIGEYKFNKVVNDLYNRKKGYEIQTDGILEESIFDPHPIDDEEDEGDLME